MKKLDFISMCKVLHNFFAQKTPVFWRMALKNKDSNKRRLPKKNCFKRTQVVMYGGKLTCALRHVISSFASCT